MNGITGMNGSLVYLVGGLAAFGVLLLFLLVRAIRDASTERMRARIKTIEADSESLFLRRQRPTTWAGQLDFAFENLVRRTGLDLRPDQATGWMLLVGAILAVAAYFIREEVWFGVAGFAVGAGAVFVSFLVYRASYLQKLQDQLPDTIFLLARSIRAGLSLEQALELIGNQGVQPLAAEFKRCHAQIQLGLPITVALENMAQELRMIDLNALASTVMVFQTTGGNLPMLLDRLAASARDRSTMRTHFRTATALARVAVVPIALACPIIVFVYLVWEPDYVAAYLQTWNGKLVVIGALLVECIGLYWIVRLLRFDY